jgi:hypothetical protein
MQYVPMYPSIVWLLDRSGHILREYIHDGHLNLPVKWDYDEDGDYEIAIGGTSNSLNCPIIVILGPENFGGVSPPGPHHPPWDEYKNSGNALYYLALPNLGPEMQTPIRISAKIQGVYSNALQAALMEGDYFLYYYFKPFFREIQSSFSEKSVILYGELTKKYPTLQSLKDKENEYVKNIKFWDGSNWVSQPSPIKN